MESQSGAPSEIEQHVKELNIASRERLSADWDKDAIFAFLEKELRAQGFTGIYQTTIDGTSVTPNSCRVLVSGETPDTNETRWYLVRRQQQAGEQTSYSAEQLSENTVQVEHWGQ